jgi:hypothetical protein
VRKETVIENKDIAEDEVKLTIEGVYDIAGRHSTRCCAHLVNLFGRRHRGRVSMIFGGNKKLKDLPEITVFSCFLLFWGFNQASWKRTRAAV